MPVKDPLPLTRAQIAEFVGQKHETIRRIERLFEVAGEETPNLLEGIEIIAGNAVALVNSLNALFEAFTKETEINLAILESKISVMMHLENKIDELEFLMHATGDHY